MENPDFNLLAKRQKSTRMRIRLLALAHFYEGHSRYQIAQFLKVSRTSVNKWITQYHQGGIDALNDKKTTGRPFRLSEQQRNKIKHYVSKQAKSDAGGRLIGTDIQTFIQTEFGFHYHLSSVYRLLNKLGFSWITSRSKHPKQSQVIQNDFKKIPNKNDL